MRHQRISQEELYSCRWSMTFSVNQKTTKKNAWQMPNSYLCSQGDLENDKGHLLVLVLKRSGTGSVKTVHKEYGTLLLKGCCWNSQRADVQFSVLRAHCPEVNSKAKDMESCRNTIQPIWKRLRLFRIIVSANQLSLYGAVAEICEEYESLHERTRRPVVMEGNQVPHSCSVRSRQKYLWIVMTQLTKIFYCSNMENEVKSYHNKTNWVNFVWMQDFWTLLKLDIISWRKTLQNFHSFMQWPVVNTLFQEKKKHHNQKDGSKGTRGSGGVGSCNQLVICTVSMELRSEFGLWTETILTPGSELLMDQTSLWWIWTTMSKKFQKFSSKNMR